MEKEFNVEGKCIPSRHYMADVSKKLVQTVKMVEKGKYFIINRPRQYGKTTTLNSIEELLHETGEYMVFSISLEGISNQNFASDASLAAGFVRLLARSVEYFAPERTASLLALIPTINNFDDLSNFITDFTAKTDKKVVILIDEVDQSANNQLFIEFLALLRSKYLVRDKISTFHSVVLAGLHDVKSLKLKLRPNEEQKYNSPWNIAADFDVVMELQPDEIVPMLKDYAQERQVTMDFQAIAAALFYYTEGYPFLVSALCKIVDEKILPNRTDQTWTVFDIETAADRMIKSYISNTNFDSLIKNLENNAELYDIIYRIVVENEIVPHNIHAPLISLALQHGILRNGQVLGIHNRIYREVIVNYMTVKAITERKSLPLETTEPYLLANNGLDMRKVLLKFQEQMQLEYSKKDDSFIERHGRLIFLAFLKPIINGKGYAFKEPEISEERRMDITVSFFQHKYVVELKMWRGKVAHDKGLKQLGNYLDRQLLPEGFLVIFEQTATKSWKKGWIKVNGKRVFAVWV
ncbi:MAG: AAA family ATPase [Saprospiraceae bacterium]|nr:AAA family ATPase [Saprospiraceae bacterium]